MMNRVSALILAAILAATTALAGSYYVYFASDYGTPSQDTLTNVIGRMGTNIYEYLVVDGGTWTLTNGVVTVPQNVELIVKRGSSIVENGGTLDVQTVYYDVKHFSDLFVENNLQVSGTATIDRAIIGTIAGDGNSISNIAPSPALSNTFVCLDGSSAMTSTLHMATNDILELRKAGFTTNYSLDFQAWSAGTTDKMEYLNVDLFDGHDSTYFYPASNPDGYVAQTGQLHRTESKGSIAIPVGLEIVWTNAVLSPGATSNNTVAVGEHSNGVFWLMRHEQSGQTNGIIIRDDSSIEFMPYLRIEATNFSYGVTNVVNDGYHSYCMACENATNDGTRCVMFSAGNASYLGGKDSFILGGADNHIYTNAHESAIIASGGNKIYSDHELAVHMGMLGGDHNLASNYIHSVIVGGQYNEMKKTYNGASGVRCAIVAGEQNVMQGRVESSVILGGRLNRFNSNDGPYPPTSYSAIIAGFNNTIATSAYSVAMGYGSLITNNYAYTISASSHGDYTFSVGSASMPHSLWMNDMEVWSKTTGPTNGIWWLIGSTVPTSSSAAASSYTIVPSGTNIYLCYTNDWLGSGTNWIVIHGELF